MKPPSIDERRNEIKQRERERDFLRPPGDNSLKNIAYIRARLNMNLNIHNETELMSGY